MAIIKDFEQLECWKAAIQLYIFVHHLLENPKFKSEFSYKDQMKRAVLSISNNIAEGFERKTPKERTRYIIYANGSAAEVKSMIKVGRLLNLISDEDYQHSMELCVKCQKLIKGFLRYLGSVGFE